MFALETGNVSCSRRNFIRSSLASRGNQVRFRPACGKAHHVAGQCQDHTRRRDQRGHRSRRHDACVGLSGIVDEASQVGYAARREGGRALDVAVYCPSVEGSSLPIMRLPSTDREHLTVSIHRQGQFSAEKPAPRQRAHGIPLTGAGAVVRATWPCRIMGRSPGSAFLRLAAYEAGTTVQTSR